MRGIGGNLTAQLQKYTIKKNDIGEQIKTWTTVKSLKGWLDMQSGDARYTSFNAKLQESTHIFISDYVPLPDGIKPENCRMLVNGKAYDVLMLDNPMEMGHGSQWEIFLKYTGGQ